MNYCAGKKFDRAIKMPLRVYSTIENGEKKNTLNYAWWE